MTTATQNQFMRMIQIIQKFQRECMLKNQEMHVDASVFYSCGAVCKSVDVHVYPNDENCKSIKVGDGILAYRYHITSYCDHSENVQQMRELTNMMKQLRVIE